MSVLGGAVMVNSVGSEVGGARSVFVNLKPDIMAWYQHCRLVAVDRNTGELSRTHPAEGRV